MKPWKRIDPTTITKVGWRKITTKTFQMPDGEVTTFDTLHPDGQEFVAVLALTPDNQVVITRQFRPGPEKVMDELPGGFVDTGESLETAAKREFQEETGYVPGELHYLGAFHKDTYMNSKWHGFIAFNCTQQTVQNLEPEEHVDVVTISINQLLHNAMHDNMTDHAIVLLAYKRLQNFIKEE